MPAWAGKWKGGRYYLDSGGQKVFFIERRRRSIRLDTHDEELAKAQLAQFLASPDTFRVKHERPAESEPVYITKERIDLYLESIRKASADHQTARAKYLAAWSELGLDLRTVDKSKLRVALGTMKKKTRAGALVPAGGHKGRAEALNAFCEFLVAEGELPAWNRLQSHLDPKPTRAARVAYSIEQLRVKYATLVRAGQAEDPRSKGARSPRLADVFLLRASTGMHETEVDQLEGARVFNGPLPEKGPGIRVLAGEHTIRGVLQVMHKSRRIHRQSVDAAALAAALRLREGVPTRTAIWEAFGPEIVPSNLRHTFATLAGEIGELVTWTGAGVDRARIAQAIGHRRGSTMISDRYEHIQIPPMIRLPSIAG